MPKVTKAIEKLKHPNSRKTLALAKQMKKSVNRQKKKQDSGIKINILGEKILWFKTHLLPDFTIYTPEQTEELIEIYLGRFDDELEQIALKHSIGGRKNRQHANREDILRLNKEREREEYETCGIEMPDLLNEKQMKMLRNWNGELRYIQNFTLRRIGRSHLEKLKSKSDVKDLENDDVEMIVDTKKD